LRRRLALVEEGEDGEDAPADIGAGWEAENG
jgi:hypothetical protein